MTNWTPVEPLTDEPQDAAFWEPRQFKIGDQVRIRLSGECRITGRAISLTGESVQQVGHEEWERDVEGIVHICPHTNSLRCDRFPGHPYVVEYPAPDGQAWLGHFAAIELEPLL